MSTAMNRSRKTCPSCADDLIVPDGVDFGDAQWLHDQRCAGLYPEMSVLCTGCDAALPVTPGLNVFETVWMHELDCPAYVEELFSEAS
jgi:hypothetical protein